MQIPHLQQPVTRGPKMNNQPPTDLTKLAQTVGVADAMFVLKWLIQCHKCQGINIWLPENILALSMRAIEILGKQPAPAFVVDKPGVYRRRDGELHSVVKSTLQGLGEWTCDDNWSWSNTGRHCSEVMECAHDLVAYLAPPPPDTAGPLLQVKPGDKLPDEFYYYTINGSGGGWSVCNVRGETAKDGNIYTEFIEQPTLAKFFAGDLIATYDWVGVARESDMEMLNTKSHGYRQATPEEKAKFSAENPKPKPHRWQTLFWSYDFSILSKHNTEIDPFAMQAKTEPVPVGR